MNLTEDYIQKLVKAFDYEKALTEIISVYHEPLYWLIRKLVISHEDTNDVLQNTYLRIYKGLSNFRFQSTIKTWCYRIAYNESMRINQIPFLSITFSLMKINLNNHVL